MTCGNRRHIGTNRRPWQTAALVAALLAILWQTILVQAHFHARTSVTSVRLGGDASPSFDIRDDRPAPNAPGDCPICDELAHTGAFLLPGIITFRTPDAAHIWMGALPSLGSALVRRSHAWRSRAPPLHPQA